MNIKIEKVSEVPPQKGGFGMLSVHTVEAMERMSEMEIGEIHRIPFSEYPQTEQVKELRKKMMNGVHSARGRLRKTGMVFKRHQRGLDFYVQRVR
jgi:hypothetical protein|tara:strand:+ start:179 stop:463 length:285 start_codon:yes stop_codon:yes gene_type:complete